MHIRMHVSVYDVWIGSNDNIDSCQSYLLKDESLISLQAKTARVSLTTPTLSSSNGIIPSTTPPKTSCNEHQFLHVHVLSLF